MLEPSSFYCLNYLRYRGIVIRSHRSTTYVYAAYCYWPSSVVCRSVRQSITLMNPAKTTTPIEMLFGLRTRVGPGNHVLDGSADPHVKGGKGASHCKV